MGTTAGPRATIKRFDAAMLRGVVVHYLFDLTWAGQTFRLSRSTLVVPSTATGEDLQFEGILEDEIEWEEALELFSDTAESNSFPFSVVLPANVPQLVSRGHDLAAATGELSLWIEGTNYEDRRILIQGRLTDPEYGFEGDPITASLQSESFEDAALVPPVGQVVTLITWPTAVSSAVGFYYPFVFGDHPVNDAGNFVLSRGYLVNNDPGDETILIAGHPVLASAVFIKPGASTVQVSLPVSGALDALGQYVSIVGGVGVGLGALVYDPGDDFTVRWTDSGSGHPARDGGILGGGGDLLEHMLSLATVQVDWGKVSAAKDLLNRFRFAGTIEEPVSPIDWISANLSPLLPMSLVMGPLGVYPVVWRYWAGRNDVVERIDLSIDPSIELDGPVEYDGAISNIVNTFTLRYGVSIFSGETRSILTLGRSEDGTPSGSLASERSILRYGVRSDDDESTIVYDTGTAGMILDWWARARALPSRLVHYIVGNERSWLDRGMVVSVTHPELYLEDYVGLVENVVHMESGAFRLSVRLLEQPSHTLHTGEF